jgi:hypothetical protein
MGWGQGKGSNAPLNLEGQGAKKAMRGRQVGKEGLKCGYQQSGQLPLARTHGQKSNGKGQAGRHGASPKVGAGRARESLFGKEGSQ